MAPKKGTTNNPNGRKAGVANKSTDELRSVFASFLEANLPGMQADYDALFPKERLNFIEKVAKLIIPPPLMLENLTDQHLDQIIKGITFDKSE